MKLVFVTQVFDRADGVLGFVPRWVEGLAKCTEAVQVLALEVGELGTLPDNVEVKTIGRKGRVRRFLRYRGFLHQAFGAQGFDTLLAHMVPRYSTLADGVVRKYGGRNFLWYTHKGVDQRLLDALQVVDKVFTASDCSFRVATDKKVITGHGIDLQHFPKRGPRAADGCLRMVSVGRLTPAKDPLTTLRALAQLKQRGLPAKLTWVGAGLVGSDSDYHAEILQEAQTLEVSDQVEWAGMVPYREIPEQYAAADLLVSTSRTGSVDKVVLEAMAARLPIVASGEAYPPLWTDLEPEDQAAMTFPVGQADAMADRVQALWEQPAAQRAGLGERLRGLVERDHEVDRLMAQLVAEMQA